MSANTTIYTGFWINYSKGSALGSTLTLTQSHGGILIAALAIFIQLIGGQSWGIMRFATHQLRTTTKARDALHHQQQAILRNDNSDISSIWILGWLAYAWRSRSPNSFWRSITLILLCVLHLLAFGAAGILASRMTTTDDEVLISKNPYCGRWDLNTTMGQVNIITYGTTTMQASGEYVQNCLAESQSLPECHIFKKVQLNWTSSEDAPCPFGDLCLGQPNSSLYMDTGLLDSRDDFGINSQHFDRVQWRKRATCMPITTSGYTQQGVSFIDYTYKNIPGRQTINYTALFYGPDYNMLSAAGLTDPAISNATYVFTNFQTEMIPYSDYTEPPYYLQIQQIDDLNLGFDPIPALNISNASLTLSFATFFAGFSEPSEDLWLPAHVNVTEILLDPSGDETNLTLYYQDEAVSVLACLEQHQFCNPSRPADNTSRCTPFRSTFHGYGDLDTVMDNDHQIAVAKNLVLQSELSSFAFTIDMLPLLAMQFMGNGIGEPLAPNQWILEAQHWFTASLQNMQRLMLETTTGPSDPHYLKFVPENQADSNPNLAWMCQNQIVRRADYTNFRTISIALIFSLGFLVCVVNQSLETVVGWFRSRWRSGRWKQRAWWSEGTLQLQRRAFEGMGITDWELDEWNRVPVTEKDTVFNAFRNWDQMLPVNLGDKDTPTSPQTITKDGPTLDASPTEKAVVQTPSEPHLSNEAIVHVVSSSTLVDEDVTSDGHSMPNSV